MNTLTITIAIINTLLSIGGFVFTLIISRKNDNIKLSESLSKLSDTSHSLSERLIVLETERSLLQNQNKKLSNLLSKYVDGE